MRFPSSADISFFIDSVACGSFQYSPPVPPTPNEYIYNALMWHADSLSHGQHLLTLQNGLPSGQASLILLDYVIYTM